MEPWLTASRDLLEPYLRDRPVVLLDVGAAGAPPDVWRMLAPMAVYVGFDPDLRDRVEDDTSGFRRFVMVDKAVSDEDGSEVTFHLTTGPHCSSVLPPDPDRVGDYAFADLFAVERTATVAATSFQAALADVGVHGIDWLKLDTQGKDLDLLTSLPRRVRRSLLAVDVEPGLDAYYRGENTFEQLHAHPCMQGFWLSRLDLQQNPRVASTTRRALPADIDAGALPGSPTAAEARYLRTVAHLDATGADVRAHACLWLFAMADDRPGAALDVAARLGDIEADLGEALRDLTLAAVRTEQRRRARSMGGVAKRVLPESLHPLARKLRDRG